MSGRAESANCGRGDGPGFRVGRQLRPEQPRDGSQSHRLLSRGNDPQPDVRVKSAFFLSRLSTFFWGGGGLGWRKLDWIGLVSISVFEIDSVILGGKSALLRNPFRPASAPPSGLPLFASNQSCFGGEFSVEQKRLKAWKGNKITACLTSQLPSCYSSQ